MDPPPDPAQAGPVVGPAAGKAPRQYNVPSSLNPDLLQINKTSIQTCKSLGIVKDVWLTRATDMLHAGPTLSRVVPHACFIVPHASFTALHGSHTSIVYGFSLFAKIVVMTSITN